MSEFNIEDLDAVIARSREGSLAQMLALQLRGQIRKSEQLAAENKRLTDVAQGGAFVMQKALMKYEFGVGMTMQAEDFIRDAREKHPATDRIIAGIKAESRSHDLNAFISHYSAELDEHIANGGDQFDATSIRLRGFIVAGCMFRENLRDEDKALALREGAK